MATCSTEIAHRGLEDSICATLTNTPASTSARVLARAGSRLATRKEKRGDDVL